MAEQSSFIEHIRYLGARLRIENDMAISQQGRGIVLLANDVVQLKFFPGDERDPYVQVHISYTDPTILGTQSSYFELRRYIDYCDARNLFPIRYPIDSSEAKSTNHLGLNREYSFSGSGFLVLEIMNFLTVHGQFIVHPDIEKMSDFMEWIRKGDRDYTERCS